MAEALMDEDDQRFHTFKKLAALAIILITLFAAVVEVLHERDSAQADETALEAQAAAIQATQDAANTYAKFAIAYENFAMAERDRAAAASANQQLTNPPPLGWSSDKVAALHYEEQSLSAQARLTQNDTAIQGQYGPDADSNFPYGFLSSISVAITQDEARSELLRAEHAAWMNRAVSYLAILTVLAVAVYLLGLGLTISEKGVRRIMASVSAVLVLVGVSWTGLTQSTPVPGVDEEAVSQFALGVQSLSTASTTADYTQAWKHFDTAINRTPTFARAYLGRSIADFLLGAPDGDRSLMYQSYWAYASSAPWIEKSIADLKAAAQYGLKTKLVYESIADNTFLLWASNGPADPNDALSYMKRAQDLDQGDASIDFLKGVELLALGRESEAKIAYDQGISHLRDQGDLKFVEVPIALSELEILAVRQGIANSLNATIRTLKEKVVAALYPPATNHAPTTVTVEARIAQPGTLEWAAQTAGFDSQQDAVVVEWYYRHSRGSCAAAPSTCGLWVNMTVGSGALSTCVQAKFGCVNETETSLFGSERILQYGTGTQCIGDGEYRVELYVNGALAARSPIQTISKGWDKMTEYRVTDLGLAFCGAQDWNSMPNAVPGMLRGFASSDKTSGYFVARLEHPADASTGTDLLVRTDVHRAIEQLGSGVLPSGLKLADEGQAVNFKSLTSPRIADYDYPGGTLAAGAGLAAGPASGLSTGQPFDRATIVVAVWGPTDFVASNTAYVIGSLTPIWRSALDNGTPMTMGP